MSRLPALTRALLFVSLFTLAGCFAPTTGGSSAPVATVTETGTPVTPPPGSSEAGGGVVTGTGDTFSGGGNYDTEIATLKASAKKAYARLEAAENENRFCHGVPGMTAEQKTTQRGLLVQARAGILSRIDGLKIVVVPGPLSVEDRNHKSHAVRARFLHPKADGTGETRMEVLQSVWESSARKAVVNHEWVHASLDTLYDYEAAPNYPGETGVQDELDAFGLCASEAIEDLVENSAEVLAAYGTDGSVRSASASTHIRFGQQSDGKVLVSAHAIVKRLTKSGSLDATFGVNGIVEIPDRVVSDVTRILVRPDDSFFVVGMEATTIYTPVLSHFSRDGVLDQAFYDNCQRYIYRYYNVSQWFTGVTVLADGKIMAIGGAYTGGRYVYAIYRFLADGTPDMTLSPTGHCRPITPAGSSSSVMQDFAVDAKGRILISGTMTGDGIVGSPLGIVRLLADGTADISFGIYGTTIVYFGTGGTESHSRGGIIAQPDGKILVAGFRISEDGEQSAIVRLTEKGSVDGTFGTAGITIPFKGTSGIYAMALAADGKILLGGMAFANDLNNLMVARLKSNGVVDDKFKDARGTKGVKFLGSSGQAVRTDALLPLATGEILVGSWSATGNVTEVQVTALVGGDGN